MSFCPGTSKTAKSQKCRSRLSTEISFWTFSHFSWCLRNPEEGRCSKQEVEHRPGLVSRFQKCLRFPNENFRRSTNRMVEALAHLGYLGQSIQSALVVQRPLPPFFLLRSSESSPKCLNNDISAFASWSLNPSTLSPPAFCYKR